MEFVSTPFAVRCNVVKVWRALPGDIWRVLGSEADVQQSRRREQLAVVAVLVMAMMILAGFTGAGHPGQRVPRSPVTAALWVVAPPLAGWGFVRLLWIPLASAGRPTREATMAFTRHLSGVYLYVYLMIVLGVGLMLLLARIAPMRTETFRYCLWWFLFGESFFVPAVMWLRLVRHDASGCVFGRSRHLILMLYLVVFVAFPLVGMYLEFA